jgi:hypothetical protein
MIPLMYLTKTIMELAAHGEFDIPEHLNRKSITKPPVYSCASEILFYK